MSLVSNDLQAVGRIDVEKMVLFLNVVYSDECITYRLIDKNTERWEKRIDLLRMIGVDFDNPCGFSVSIPATKREVGQSILLIVPFAGVYGTSGTIRFTLEVDDVFSTAHSPHPCFPYMCDDHFSNFSTLY